MKNNLPLAALCLFGLAALHAQTPTPTPATDFKANPVAPVAAINPALPTLWVASDSTAANGGPDSTGWGVPLPNYFDLAKINVVNRAVAGRSSRTFITEGLWDRLLAGVKAGDFVLIQFGHNDAGAVNAEPPGSKMPLRARGSIKTLGEETEEIDNVVTKKHEVVHTYGWYMRKMVADVKAKSATPIILSLTVRNEWKDGKVERYNGPWRQFSKEIAETAGISYIDLTRLIADEYQKLGQEKVKAFFPKDSTHTGPAGADLNASLVVAGLKGIRKGPFAAFLSAKGAAVESDRLGWLNLPELADPKLPSIVLIGDSTVRNGRGDGTGEQWGWGDELGVYFDPAKVNVVNRAVGGTTARTFINIGYWERTLALIKPGDYVIMQFGTNDSGSINDNSRARGSLPGTGEETQEIDNLLTKQHEVVHTNGWYIRKLIRDTCAAGATPIVCSLIPRKAWDKAGRIVRSVNSSALWARQVAEQEKAGFIDLNELIAARYDALGHDAVMKLFPQVTPDEHTHPNLAGAQLNAEIVTSGLRALPGAPLDTWLSDRGRATPAAK